MLKRWSVTLSRTVLVAVLLPLTVQAQSSDSVPAPPPADDTAPAAPDSEGVAHVSPPGVCGGAGCGPRSCGPANGSCRADGSCHNGFCQNSSGGLPCLGPAGQCLTVEELLGRPYTFGDLKRDLHSWKCSTSDYANDYSAWTGCQSGGWLHDWWHGQNERSNWRRAYRNRVLAAHLHNKFNYFHPGGCCGEGCPPFGEYKRVYAAQPDYFDARDSRLYAAPATGVPTAIPLAPNVHYQYNYGWGIPSSRLTPVSSFVPPRY